MIRDRFALAILGVTVGALPVFALLAELESTRRSVDVVVLLLSGALQLGLLVTWIFISRLPKWIVAGWGLILAATGLGVIITAPLSAAEGGTTPWGLIGLLVVGIVTMILAVVHRADEKHL